MNGAFPPAAVLGQDGKPLLSWRVLMLPYIEQQDLFREFKLDEPWDSPHNQRLIARMPRTYEPYHKSDAPPNTTYFRVLLGPGTVFGPAGGPARNLNYDFKTGTSNFFLIVEAAEPVLWTKPDELVYHPDGPLPELGGILRDGTFRAAMADGSVSTLNLADEGAIRAAIMGKPPPD